MLIRDVFANGSVEVNGRFLPHTSLDETVTRSCRLVLRESSNPALPLGRTGSATLVLFAGQKYVILTRHQLDIEPGHEPTREQLEKVRISSGIDRLTNIPTQLCVYETSNPDEQFHDLLVFKVADTWRTQSADAPYFFRLEGFSKQARRISIVAGYPTSAWDITDYIDAFYEANPDVVPEMPLIRAARACDIDPAYSTHNQHLRHYICRNEGEMDGFSGGAVFSLIGDIGNFKMVLDGIVVMAGQRHVYAVDADYLVGILSSRHRLRDI